MISIALLIFIVGVSCASAINLDVEKGTKALGSDELIKVTGDASDRELLRHYFGPRYQVTKKPKNYKPAIQSTSIYYQGKKHSREYKMIPRGDKERTNIAEKLAKIQMNKNITVKTGNDSGSLPIKFKMAGDEIYKIVNGKPVLINPDHPIPIGPINPDYPIPLEPFIPIEPFNPEPIHIVEK